MVLTCFSGWLPRWKITAGKPSKSLLVCDMGGRVETNNTSSANLGHKNNSLGMISSDIKQGIWIYIYWHLHSHKTKVLWFYSEEKVQRTQTVFHSQEENWVKNKAIPWNCLKPLVGTFVVTGGDLQLTSVSSPPQTLTLTCNVSFFPPATPLCAVMDCWEAMTATHFRGAIS